MEVTCCGCIGRQSKLSQNIWQKWFQLIGTKIVNTLTFMLYNTGWVKNKKQKQKQKQNKTNRHIKKKKKKKMQSLDGSYILRTREILNKNVHF